MKLIREEITDIEFVTEDTSDNKKNYFIAILKIKELTKNFYWFLDQTLPFDVL